MRDAQLARLRAPAIVLTVAALVAAIGVVTSRPPTPPRPLAYIYPATIAAYDATEAVTRLDQRIAGEAPLIQPGDWLSRGAQAQRFTDRARLTGDLADYAAAGRLLDVARSEAAGAGSGPDLIDAAWHMAVHRLPGARDALDRIDRYAERTDAEARELRVLRGDIAFYRGDYATARTAWSGASADAAQPIRLALYDQKTGQPDAALVELDTARRAPRFITAQATANIAYQRGMIELQRGRWAEAEAAFAAADRIFGGYWLILQARAQMRAVHGDMPSAVALYRRAIALARNPETMDALAALYRAAGDRTNSDPLAGRAAAVWARWTRLLPEAAYAHALDHELAFGSPRRAAALAIRNWRARPYGASATALAWALLANGRAAEAARLIDALNASPWRTAEQHAVGVQAAEALGDSAKAKTERAAALALNPRIFDRAAAAIWIGH